MYFSTLWNDLFPFKNIAELSVLLEEISWSLNTNCILFALKNLFCICESSVRAGCDSVPPTITPGQAFIGTISMAVIQLKQDFICWILRVAKNSEGILTFPIICCSITSPKGRQKSLWTGCALFPLCSGTVCCNKYTQISWCILCQCWAASVAKGFVLGRWQ